MFHYQTRRATLLKLELKRAKPRENEDPKHVARFVKLSLVLKIDDADLTDFGVTAATIQQCAVFEPRNHVEFHNLTVTTPGGFVHAKQIAIADVTIQSEATLVGYGELSKPEPQADEPFLDGMAPDPFVEATPEPEFVYAITLKCTVTLPLGAGSADQLEALHCALHSEVELEFEEVDRIREEITALLTQHAVETVVLPSGETFVIEDRRAVIADFLNSRREPSETVQEAFCRWIEEQRVPIEEQRLPIEEQRLPIEEQKVPTAPTAVLSQPEMARA